MKPNVGNADRVLRIVIGLAILGTGYSCNSWWGLVGLIPLLTGIFRFCPAYLPFGFTTCEKGEIEEEQEPK